MAYFPFMIEIKNKKALVVGAGNKAKEIVRDLIDFGADVKVVAPVISADVLKQGKRCIIERRVYTPGEAGNYDIAVAATDDSKVNSQVAHDSDRKDTICAVPDDFKKSGFAFPTLIKRDGYSVAIYSSDDNNYSEQDIRQVISSALTKFENHENDDVSDAAMKGTPDSDAGDKLRLADIEDTEEIRVTSSGEIAEGDTIRIAVGDGRLSQLKAESVISYLDQAGRKSIKIPFKNGIKEAVTRSLSEGEVDLVVISADELLSYMPNEEVNISCLPRGDARDVLVTLSDMSMDRIKFIGAQNEAQMAQIRRFMSDGDASVISGPVMTGIERLKDGDLDALLITASDAERLRLFGDTELRCEYMDTDRSLPAAGKGITAIVSRNQGKSADAASEINDADTELLFNEERDFVLAASKSDCDSFAAHAVLIGDEIMMKAMEEKAGRIRYHSDKVSKEEAGTLGKALAARFE